MLQQIENICFELRCDKIKTRQKAFVTLYDILNSRASDLQEALRNNEDLSWKSLFSSAHKGITVHCQKLNSGNTELNENDSRISHYSKVLLKICDAATHEEIPYSLLMSTVCQALADDSIRNYFGRFYIQILQKHILKPTNDLKEVSLEDWKTIVEILFQLMKSKRHSMPFMDLVTCAKLSIELGCAFSHLSTVLATHLEPLTALLEKRSLDRERLELLNVAYHLCRSIAVESRFAVCQFTETNAKVIHSVFKVDLAEESKEMLFKLMDLSLVVHYPSLNEDRCKLEFVSDRTAWYVQLRNFEYAAHQEMKLPPKSRYRSGKLEMNQIVVQFMARLTCLMYWDDSFWLEIEADESQPAKRIQRANKLQTLLDFAQPSTDPNEFNWKWLVVISEVIYNYPLALRNENFQPLLHILAQVQPMIENELHVYAFTKCSFVLLQREPNFIANDIVTKLCNDYWNKIADASIRVCTTSNKHSVENHILLQTLLHHQKCSSNSSIKDIIKIFLDNATIKSDATLQTLVTLMQSFNLDTLPNGNELAAKILTYTFEKPNISNLKKVITTSSSKKPTARILSKVAVMCCLSKTDLVNVSKAINLDGETLFTSNWNLEPQMKYKAEVNDVINLILLKTNERLLIQDHDFATTNVKFVDKNKAEFPVEIKCIVDQNILEELARATEFKSKIMDDTKDDDDIKDYLRQVLENIELMMHLADSFLQLEAFNESLYKSLFFVKKIEFHMQEIEKLFEMILDRRTQLDVSDTNRILNLVKSLFSSGFHKKICLTVRSFELSNCIRWVSKQVKHNFTADSDDDDNEVKAIGWKEFVNAKMEEKQKFLAIETLCGYNNYEGLNTDIFTDRLSRVEFDIDSNADLHAVWNVWKILGQQDYVPQEVVDWLLLATQEICQTYHNHQYISGLVIESLPDIVYLLKGNHNATSNLVMLFRAFGKLCANPEYNPQTSVNYIRNFKYFHQQYFELFIDEEHVIEMYSFITENFLNSPVFAVKMEAIKTVSYILLSDIEQNSEFGEMRSPRSSKNDIFRSIFDAHRIVYNVNEMETNAQKDDEETNRVASCIQLFTSLFCVNFCLRKPIIFEISKVFLRHQLPEELAANVFNKMLTYLKCDVGSLMDSNSVIHLISTWINDGYTINTFPYFFTGHSSFDTFVKSSYELILLALLKNNCRSIDHLCVQMEISTKKAIEDLMPNCFAFLLPIEAGCVGIKYEKKAEEMKTKIDSVFNSTEQKSILLQKTPLVISHVLENVYDRNKFTEICGFEMQVTTSLEMIDCENFNKCLVKLLSNFANTSNQTIFTFFCNEKKYRHFIEKILLLSKKKVQSTTVKEHKLLYLMQYCVIVQKLEDFLTKSTPNPSEGMKPFIVRDVTNFLCFLIFDESSGTKLRETAANILSMFVKKILPKCAKEVEPFLNKILSCLVSICKNSNPQPMSELQEKCFSIIELIFTHQSILEKEIAKLDKFPDNSIFDDLRPRQLELKYKRGKFTLVEEIEHFLSIKKRKIEGLVALREHLAANKKELKTLFDELSASLGFSEDGENSLLHKLIRSLVSYARAAAQNEERAEEAVKCLGEIGSYDLSTMVFITEENKTTTVYSKMESVGNCQEIICRTAIEQMDTMLLHHNYLIFEAASEALYHMIESTSCVNLKPNINLHPFFTNSSSNKTLFNCEAPKEKSKMPRLELGKTIKDDEYSTYKTWIKRLVGLMLKFAGDKILLRVSDTQKSFAELMTPLMMQLLLCYNDPQLNEDIIDGVNLFFSETFEMLKTDTRVNEGSIFIDKEAIRQMLLLVECIRNHSLEHPNSSMAKLKNLDYLKIAKAAKYCEAYFTAVLYCELWAEKQPHSEQMLSKTNKTLQEVMYDALTAIGIHDASECFVNPQTNRSLYLQLSGHSWQNLLEHDASMKDDKTEDYIKLLNSMGLYFFANKLSTAKDRKMDADQYKCLWRLSNWDVLVEADSETKAVSEYRTEFEKHHYVGLKSIKHRDKLGTKVAVNKARKAIVQLMQQESLECTNNIYKFLLMSQQLQQVEDFAEYFFSRLPELKDKLLQKWEIQNKLPHDFKLIEPVLSQRNSIFDTADRQIGSRKRPWISEALQSNMLYIVREAIESGCDDEALKMMAKIRALKDLTVPNDAQLMILDAQLSRKTNKTLAKFCLDRLLNEDKFKHELIMKSVAYRVFGEIMAENGAYEIVTIQNDYFAKAVQFLESYAKRHNRKHLVIDICTKEKPGESSQTVLSSQESDDIVDRNIKENICVYDVIAGYFDREYVAKSEYIESPDFKNKITDNDRNRHKLEELKNAIVSSKDVEQKNGYKKSYVIIDKSVKLDDEVIKKTRKQKRTAATCALYYYLRGAINNSGSNVLSIFRVFSIWMAYPDNEYVLKALNEAVFQIQSYKWIVALPQLVVRLSDNNKDESNILLMKLLEKCATDHPHHTLPLILALVNSYADSAGPKNQELRVVGATKLWNILKDKLGKVVTEMEKMASVLIDLANKDCKIIPKDHKILALKHLKNVQCPTLEIPIQTDCNYKDITSVIRWSSEMVLVGGINAPKKIQCLCSDGITRPQLLKGKDDMRQDFVMQQVFGVVNQLLNSDKETKTKRARIRTYKVVPFSRRSGILEWCQNTMPIGLYLAGNSKTKGAHERYNPQDWLPSKCLAKVSEFDSCSDDTKVKNFKMICENIQPAMHHFFYENFKNPGQLFERKLAYTTSVAVASMVGYILGIGDRHVQNILIDTITAEVIHIDFGIAFEQGKILPHPELIPFRLTRDIIAPMGVSGVDGVFRKMCEKTMDILRKNSQTLTTILEVLLYDPMYNWALSNQTKRRQLEDCEENSNGVKKTKNTEENDTASNDAVEKDSMASRTLLNIKEKLKGQTDDSARYSSVEGQVESLIQRARNPTFLSQLFRGWQAYL